MSAITRWNPRREMANMRDLFDRFFEDNVPSLFDNRAFEQIDRIPALDIDEDAATYTVTSEMPGLKADNIRVTMDGDMLVIVGEHPEEVIEEKDDNKRTLMRERRYGRYSRRVQLPGGVDINRAEASYEDGVLTLTLPKSEQTIQKMIPVRASGDKQ